MEKALAVLSKIEEDQRKLNENRIEKETELDFDLGLLMASDHSLVDHEALRSDREVYLKQLACDNYQLLLQQLYQLPTETKDDIRLAKLPQPQMRLPREKPAPKPKPLSKWEQYAKTKGITRNKKAKKIWDTELKRWVPRYGAKAAQADREKNWVMEVPDNVDPNTDMFAKAAEKKQERSAKNEVQRLRNVRRHMKLPTVGVTPKDVQKRSVNELGAAAALARRSTASLGQFSTRLARDAPEQRGGRRRQFAPTTGDTAAEVRGQLEMLQTLRRPAAAAVDSEKAANRLMHQQQRERAAERADQKPSKSKKRWIPNTKKGEKQKKAIKAKAGKGKFGNRVKKGGR